MTDTTKRIPPANRLVLSSDDLPRDLDDRARARAWLDLLGAYVISSDASFAEDRPFAAHVALTSLDDLAFFEYHGTLTHMTRDRQWLATHAQEDFFFLGVNFGAPTGRCALRGREATIAPGELTLISSTEPSEFFFDLESNPRGDNTEQVDADPIWFVRIPRDMLSTLLKHPDDFALHKMNPDLPATQLLRRYLAIVFRSDGLDSDPALRGFLSRTVTDLVALAIGADRDTTEVASARGGHAAQLQLVLAGIKSGYDNPRFSAQALAEHLGLSQRHVQRLLSATGVTFSERVLELRLQRAREMLADPRYNGMKVSDIAFSCGFNEVSYFNRSFRRRFGASPTQYRS